MTDDEVYDFIIHLQEADREFEQVVVDASDPASYGFFADGWHIPEPGRVPGSLFIWSHPETSSLSFSLTKKQDMELIVNCRPLVYEGSISPLIDVLMNGQLIGAIQLDLDWSTYRMEIPDRFVTADKNLLTFRQAQGTGRPAEIWTGSSDDRLLGSSFAYFVLRPVRGPLPPDNLTLGQVLGYSNIQFKGSPAHVMHDGTHSSFSYSIRLPSHPFLSFGAGIYPESINRSAGNARMQILVKDQKTDTEKTVFDTSLKPPGRILDTGWVFYRRSLDEFAGREVAVTFLSSSDTPEDTQWNEGSWNSPKLMNQHMPVDLIFISGDDRNWPPESPQPGSHLERLAAASTIVSSVDSLPEPEIPSGLKDLLDTSDIAFPLKFTETILLEGWAIGYYYAGRDEYLMESFLGRSFDSVTWCDTTSESLGFLENQYKDWVRRIGNDHYMMILDPVLLDIPLEATAQESCVQWMYDWDLLPFTIVVCFNVQPGHPIWIHIPKQLAGGSSFKPAEKVNWADVQQFLLDFLYIHSES